MTAPRGTIRAQQKEQAILFQVEGWAQMDLGLVVRRLAEQALAQGATVLLVDLRHCAHMDSTFLGTLLFLQRALDRRKCAGLKLISPSSKCHQLLEEMGLMEFFALGGPEEIPEGEWTLLCADVNDLEAFQRNVVQAHVELAALPGRAGEPFKKVAHLLEKETSARPESHE